MQLEHWQEQIIRSLAPRKLATLLEDFVEDEAERADLIRGWSLADPGAVARVRELFTAAGLATTVIDARTYFDRLHEFTKFARMITQAEKAKTEAFRAWNAFCDRIERARRDGLREARQTMREVKEDERKTQELLLRGTHKRLWSG